jgi:hypothetical protein
VGEHPTARFSKTGEVGYWVLGIWTLWKLGQPRQRRKFQGGSWVTRGKLGVAVGFFSALWAVGLQGGSWVLQLGYTDAVGVSECAIDAGVGACTSPQLLYLSSYPMYSTVLFRCLVLSLSNYIFCR